MLAYEFLSAAAVQVAMVIKNLIITPINCFSAFKYLSLGTHLHPETQSIPHEKMKVPEDFCFVINIIKMLSLQLLRSFLH